MISVFRLRDLVEAPIWVCQKFSYMAVPVSWLFLIAQVKGRIKSWFSQERFAVMRNLNSVFGQEKTEEELQRIARRYFEYLDKFAFSQLWPNIRNFTGWERCAISGLEHLDLALSRGRGAILLTTHLGYGRLVKYILAKRGFTVRVVGPTAVKKNSSKRSRFGQFIYRELLKVPEFSRERENDLPLGLNVRPLVHALEKNEIILLTADGLRSTRLVKVKLLGRDTALAAGVVSLAKATRSMLLPSFVVDSEKGAAGFRAIIERPLEIPENERLSEAGDICLRQYAQIYEGYIYRYPHLFSWRKRDFFPKRRQKALKADVADRLRAQYKTRRVPNAAKEKTVPSN
ncbi:lysophospholipid acyltransferase family protein [bacterium]|nr:lysophospholipid acyltransferase family protein [bacterium]